MKKLLFIALISTLALSCSNDKIKLNKEVKGADLTEAACIELVRNNWDCNNGAIYSYQNLITTIVRGYTKYSCKQGHLGEIMNKISDLFEEGIDTEKSYYRNYTLYLENITGGSSMNTVQEILIVNF